MSIQKNFFLLSTILGLQMIAGAGAVRAIRHPDVKKACERSPSSVFAVLLHGSDWCGAGEELKSRVWDRDSFAALLPDTVILTASDTLERPLSSYAGRISKALKEERPLAMEMDFPRSAKGVRLTKQASGGWMVDPNGSKPVQDTLTQTLRFSAPVSMLRLGVMPRPGKVKRGSGNAPDGSFVLSEVQIAVEGKPVMLTACATRAARHYSAMAACDGVIDKNGGWSVDRAMEEHALYLFPLEEPLPANKRVTLTLHQVSRKKCATLAFYRLDGYAHRSWMPPPSVLAESVNARPLFYRAGTTVFPALNCFDAKGRMIGRRDALPYNMGEEALSEAILSMIRRRDRWEDILRQVDRAPSTEKKLPLLAEAYTLMRAAGFPGQKEVYTQIMKLDPGRKSPWTWKVAPDMGKIKATVAKFVKEGEHNSALQYLEKTLEDPRLSLVGPERRQEILMEAYTLYMHWSGHEEERFNVLKDIAALSTSTFLGSGAQGYLDLYGKGEGPSVQFGWRAGDIRTGEQTLVVRKGVPLAVYQPGFYQVFLWASRSKKPVEVKRVSLLSEGKVIAEDAHPETLDQKSGKRCLYRFEVKEGFKQESLTLGIELDAPEGHDCFGRILIQTYLPKDGPFGWKGEKTGEQTGKNSLRSR